MKTVLIDLDSIVANILDPWLDTYNKENDDSLSIKDIKSWDMEKYTKNGMDIYKIIERPDFFLNLKPLDGAVDAVERLNKLPEVKVLMVSAAPCVSAFTEKGLWVNKYLPFINKRQLILAHEKWMITGDILIDDSPRNATDYRTAHPNSYITTIAYPYNEANVMTTKGYAYDAIVGHYSNPKLTWDTILYNLKKEFAVFKDL